jgi:hypothetical protein
LKKSEAVKIRQAVRKPAKELIAQAQTVEPEITLDLQNIANKLKVNLQGLENKFKTENSLARKLFDSSIKDSSDSNPNVKLEKYAKNVNDVLRYTFVIEIDSYQNGFEQSLDILKKSGYEVVERRIWNAWKNVGTERDTGYRGINITIKSSQNQLFELQFHTEESFNLKSETHILYQAARLSKTSEKRRNEIIKRVIELAGKIKSPKEYKK